MPVPSYKWDRMAAVRIDVWCTLPLSSVRASRPLFEAEVSFRMTLQQRVTSQVAVIITKIAGTSVCVKCVRPKLHNGIRKTRS